MNKDLLNNLILRETEALKNLLKLLEEQHKLLLQNDIFGLEAVVDRIKECNKQVAEVEVERRALVKGDSMKKIVEALNDDNIDRNYREIKKLLSELEVQKNTNDLLIKQGLGFSARMLNILNPNKSVKTYNSYGKLGK
jgi:flagellar biosynthesis/type III secretory pathway chaperone